MGVILDSSLAAGLAVEVKNQPLAFGSDVLARKIVIFATALPAYSGKYPSGVPFLVLSPEDVASRCGPGSMAHRLALAAFRGSKNAVPVYFVIEANDSEATAASGTLTLSVSSPVAGTLYLYIAGKKYQIPIQKTDTAALLGDRVALAVNSDEAAPVTAANVDGVITFTSKSPGPWGNGITIAVNQRPAEGEASPPGVTPVLSGGTLSGGTGIPDFADDLTAALGSGDSANEAGFTAVLHGYGKESAVLDALSQYNGLGNENEGLYQETIARPFRSLVGDVGTGSAGLGNLITFTDNRKLDRTSGVFPRPGSLTHPAEIAAEALGYMEVTNAGRAEDGYADSPLSGIDPGVVARMEGQDWTTEYTSRDLAVHNGISTSLVKGGVVVMEDTVSFYRPDNIPEKSRCFRRMRDISIIQNIQATYKQVFGSAKWTNFTVVQNTANVTNTGSRSKARDAGMVKDDLLALITAFMGRAWLYSTAPSIAFLKTSQAVQARDGGTGFNTRIPYVLSGEGNITRHSVELDTSFAVMAQL
jgi:phage tail sheath gpL-like